MLEMLFLFGLFIACVVLGRFVCSLFHPFPRRQPRRRYPACRRCGTVVGGLSGGLCDECWQRVTLELPQ